MTRLTVEQVMRQGDLMVEAREKIIDVLNASHLSRFNAKALINEIAFDLMSRVV